MRLAFLVLLLGLAFPRPGFAQVPDVPSPAGDSLSVPLSVPAPSYPGGASDSAEVLPSLALRSPSPVRLSPPTLWDGEGEETLSPVNPDRLLGRARFPILNYVLQGALQTYCVNTARAPQRCPHPMPNSTPVSDYPFGSYPEVQDTPFWEIEF